MLRARIAANVSKTSNIFCRREGILTIIPEEVVGVHEGSYTGPIPNEGSRRSYSSGQGGAGAALGSERWLRPALYSDGGWKPASMDIQQYTQVDLTGSVEVWGVVVDSCAGVYDEYVKTFTVAYSRTGGDDDFEMVMDESSLVAAAEDKTGNSYPVPRIFQGLGKGGDLGTHERFVRRFRWNAPVMARYVRIKPMSWNKNICLRFDVLTTPGRLEGRYVTVYAKEQLGVCEVNVISETLITETRSDLCHPRALQQVCRPPLVEHAQVQANATAIAVAAPITQGGDGECLAAVVVSCEHFF